MEVSGQHHIPAAVPMGKTMVTIAYSVVIAHAKYLTTKQG
jgi:hypothetical protein